MKYELMCVDDSLLLSEEKTEIDRQIDSIIERHKGNRYQINRLVFESTAALTASENLVEQKASQGMLKRFWNNITGKNRRLQADIDRNLARAQYASQQTLQKLAEQNLMSFELITAVNNKLNASMIAVEQEINNVYGTMRDICGTMQTFFRRTRADIMQLATRIDRLERNVDLLNWQNSIEYQMYNGIEYQELDDVTKLVCMAHDFYSITKGEWRASDLLLLKAAMGTIGLDPKATMSYENFVREVGGNKELFSHLISPELRVNELATNNEILSVGLSKMNRLSTEERYITETTARLLQRNGVDLSNTDIAYQMVDGYLLQQENVHLETEIPYYELELEMLYNLEQLRYAKLEKEKAQKAKALFLNCKITEALPLLEELAEAGNVEARYMLARIYDDGLDVDCNLEHAKELIRQNLDEGYCCSAVHGALLQVIDWKEAFNFCEELMTKANQDDVFAQYELALYYFNLGNATEGKKESDYNLGLNYFEMAAAQGYFRAYHGIAKRYYIGQGVEQNGKLAEKYFKIAAEMGYGRAMLYLGDIYFRGELGVEANISYGIEWYKKAFEHHQFNDYTINQIARHYSQEGNGNNEEALNWWHIGERHKFPSSLGNLGWAYRYGHGVDVDYQTAIAYYQKGIAAGSANGYEERNLGEMYLNGYGVAVDKNIAHSWYEKAAEKGDDDAKKWIESNPV